MLCGKMNRTNRFHTQCKEGVSKMKWYPISLLGLAFVFHLFGLLDFLEIFSVSDAVSGHLWMANGVALGLMSLCLKSDSGHRRGKLFWGLQAIFYLGLIVVSTAPIPSVIQPITGLFLAAAALIATSRMEKKALTDAGNITRRK